MKEMLKKNKKIKVDSCYSGDGYTCLHFAAEQGFIKLVDLLLEKGASTLKKSKDIGQIPLELAIDENKDETAEALVKKMPRER